MEKVAVLVDGGFYRRVAQKHWGEVSAEARAEELFDYCMKHLVHKHGERDQLYRIFYYDCYPMKKKVYHPLLKRTIDYSKTELFKWMELFLDELKKKRKVALRMGVLADAQAHYNLRPEIVKKICSGTLEISDLKEEHFALDVKQKGVDMKIGVDIASLAYKKQVDKIVLISGDSDFVPAAKLARREGIDFVLDPMYSNISPSLSEHIDGLRSCFKLE